MVTERLKLALSNGPSSILIAFGLAMILHSRVQFNPAYAILLDIMPKDAWGVLFMVVGSLGMLSLFLGYRKLYQFALTFEAATFAMVGIIFSLTGVAPGGAAVYSCLALQCILILGGAPVYGFVGQPRVTPPGRKDGRL